MSKSDTVTGTLRGIAKWACFNGGSNIPAETNNQKAAQTVEFTAVDAKNAQKSGNTSGDLTIVNPGYGDTTLACQGTQVVALYSLQLSSVSDAFTVDVNAGESTIPVSLANPPYPQQPTWLYCRDGNTAACFS